LIEITVGKPFFRKTFFQVFFLKLFLKTISKLIFQKKLFSKSTLNDFFSKIYPQN